MERVSYDDVPHRDGDEPMRWPKQDSPYKWGCPEEKEQKDELPHTSGAYRGLSNDKRFRRVPSEGRV